VKRQLAGVAAVVLAAALAAQAGPTEEQQIEEVVAAVVEAYRTGDYSTLGRYYAGDVTAIPSDYSPTLEGWANLEPRYRVAQAAFDHLELLRENTRVVRRGKVAWASYQWRLAGARGKEMVQALGHTTLVLEKRGRQWVIVHNHTSLVPLRPEPAPAAPPQP
jgi:ketosteroid isomerase-like protein